MKFQGEIREKNSPYFKEIYQLVGLLPVVILTKKAKGARAERILDGRKLSGVWKENARHREHFPNIASDTTTGESI